MVHARNHGNGKPDYRGRRWRSRCRVRGPQRAIRVGWDRTLIGRSDTTVHIKEIKVKELALARTTGEPMRTGDANSKPSGFEGTKAGQSRKSNGLNTPLVWIPPGDFTMGSPKDEKDRSDDENQVQVTLTKGFWLGQHEVTQAEWQRVMQTTPWSGNEDVKEGDDYPATFVSWDDAMKFCEKLTEQERSAGRLPSDWQYTLPTEAQWEYACRAGTKSRFSFGDDESDLGEYAWYGKNAGDIGEKYAHRVAQKKANPWGLYDMHGNVWEWCRDVYAYELPGRRRPRSVCWSRLVPGEPRRRLPRRRQGLPVGAPHRSRGRRVGPGRHRGLPPGRSPVR